METWHSLGYYHMVSISSWQENLLLPLDIQILRNRQRQEAERDKEEYCRYLRREPTTIRKTKMRTGNKITSTHNAEGKKRREVIYGMIPTFKTAARNKSGCLLIAEATRSPPALYPQPASLFSITNPSAIRNSAQEI